MRLVYTTIFLFLFQFGGLAQNVGIGTVTPQSTLHITGGLTIQAFANLPIAGALPKRDLYVDREGKLLIEGQIESFVSINASDFTGNDPAINISGTRSFVNNTGTAAIFAPVNLPYAGFSLTSFRAVILDKSNQDLTVLLRGKNYDGTINTIAFTESSGNSNTLQQYTVNLTGQAWAAKYSSYFIVVKPATGDTWDSTNLQVRMVNIGFLK